MVIQLFILFLVISLLIQFLYWVLIFKQIDQKSKITNKNNENPEISIVVCGFNEEPNLDLLLTKILAQDYPIFELIFVDDNSSDQTAAICTNYKERFPYFTYVFNPNTEKGKKQALSLGIKSAKYDWILLTDADCAPKSPYWLKRMAGEIDERSEIILGYAPFYKKSSLINQLARYECFLNAWQYYSAQQLKIPYAGVGRNLLYKKTIFQTDNKLISGDDDLLISAKANDQNTGICLDKDSFVYSNAPSNYKNYFLQKWRHYNTSVFYSLQIKLILLSYYGSLFLFYFSVVFLVIQAQYGIALGAFLIRTFFVFYSLISLTDTFEEEDLRYKFVYLEVLYLMHLCMASPFVFIKKRDW